MKITCANREKVVYINKVGNIVEVDIVEDVKIAEITLKSICNTFC